MATTAVNLEKVNRPKYSPSHDFQADPRWRLTDEEVELIVSGTADYRRQLLHKHATGQKCSINTSDVTSALMQQGGESDALVKTLIARPLGLIRLVDRVRYQLSREGFVKNTQNCGSVERNKRTELNDCVFVVTEKNMHDEKKNVSIVKKIKNNKKKTTHKRRESTKRIWQPKHQPPRGVAGNT